MKQEILHIPPRKRKFKPHEKDRYIQELERLVMIFRMEIEQYKLQLQNNA